METRRAEVLRAAVLVLGGGGSRALTHRAVDAAGNLPAGTASNHFRTRDALIGGVLEHILAEETERYAALGDTPQDPGTDAIVRDAGAMLRFLAGPGRALALARHVIFLEAAWRPELRSVLIRGSRTWWEVVAERLRAAGVAESHTRARHFLACLDGLLIDQLCRPDPEFEPEPAISALLIGLLRGSAVRAGS